MKNIPPNGARRWLFGVSWISDLCHLFVMSRYETHEADMTGMTMMMIVP